MTRIIDVIFTGSNLPKFLVADERGVAVYTVMECFKQKNKDLFSVRLRCLNQSTDKKCKAGITLHSKDSEIFEFAKNGRALKERWGFKRNLKSLSTLNFEEIQNRDAGHTCEYKYKESLLEMKYLYEIRKTRLSNPHMKESIKLKKIKDI